MMDSFKTYWVHLFPSDITQPHPNQKKKGQSKPTFICRKCKSLCVFNVILLSLSLGSTDDHILTIFWICLNNNFMSAACRLHCKAPYLKEASRPSHLSIEKTVERVTKNLNKLKLTILWTLTMTREVVKLNFNQK